MATVFAPPLRPPRYSLIVAARDATAGDEPGTRFNQFGFRWIPAACDNEIGPGPEMCDLTAQEAEFGTSISPDVSDDCDDQTFEPVPLWAGYRVSAFSPPDDTNIARARARLAATESHQLAKELWAGAVAIASTPDLPNNYFAKTGSSSTVSGGPFGIPELVGVADDALGDCLFGARGMLHVNPKHLAFMVADSVVTREGNLWVTPMGNVVVADTGYPGTGPAGTGQWAFATGMVDVRLDTVQVLDGRFAFHRRTNTYELRAQRLAAAVFDPCCCLALQIDPCSTPCAA